MLFRTSSFLTLVYVASMIGTAAAVNCAVCPASIFFDGLTRTLTSSFQSSVVGFTQCNYDTPAISGLNPNCSYRNSDGVLNLSNTDGACPSVTSVVSKTSC